MRKLSVLFRRLAEVMDRAPLSDSVRHPSLCLHGASWSNRFTREERNRLIAEISEDVAARWIALHGWAVSSYAYNSYGLDDSDMTPKDAKQARVLYCLMKAEELK
jgi:hypothetical protein